MNAVTERQVGGDRVSAVDPLLARTCARPACSAPAVATLAFFYGAREVSLGKLGLDEIPATYDLCATHADRMRPPYGWVLNDHRGSKHPEAAPSSSDQDASSSIAPESQSAMDASSPFRWWGVAVQATVAFYPPKSEAFDDLPAVEPAEEPSRFEAGSSEATLPEPGSREASEFETVPDDTSLFGSDLDDTALFGPDLDDIALFDSGPDDTSLFESGLNETLPEEDFVPIRARSW